MKYAGKVVVADDVQASVDLLTGRLIRDGYTVHSPQTGGHQAVRPSLLVSQGEIPESADPSTFGWLAPIDNRETQLKPSGRDREVTT